MRGASGWAVSAGYFHALSRIAVGLGIVVFLVWAAPPRSRRQYPYTPTITRHPILTPPLTTVGRNNTTAKETGDWRTIWAENRARLCPGGSPDVAAHQVALLASARRAVGLHMGNSSDELGFVQGFPRRTLGRWLFRLSQGGWAFTNSPLTAKGRANVAYIRNFKCATGQLHAYGVEQLARGGGALRHYSAGNHFRRVIASAACVLMIVRDPVQHFLSGYNEAETRLGNDSRYAHSSDALSLRFTQNRMGSPERFASFLTQLLSGGVEHAPAWFTHDLLPHVFPLTGALHEIGEAQRSRKWAQGRGKVLLVPLSEVQTEVPRQLRTKCGLPRAPPMKRAGQRPSSHDPTGAYAAAQWLWSQGGDTAKALCALHALDYACLHDLFPPPRPCLDVFGDPALLQTISHPAPT